MLRRNLRYMKIKRWVEKHKQKERKQLQQTGNNFPIHIERLKTWHIKKNKQQPFLL